MNAIEQDKAAGGAELRKMRTKTGDIVTVSLAVSTSNSGTPLRVTLRFKWGGTNVQRPVGTFEVSSRFEALELGWKTVREKQIAEKEGWAWVTASPLTAAIQPKEQ